MDAHLTHDRLTRAIEDLARRYLAEGKALSLYDVNDGQCEDFAEEVAQSLGGETARFEGTWADNLTVDGRGCAWDVELILRLWPRSEPTHGLTWEDVISEIPAHYWLVLDGRHYDAECPGGVDNFLDFPLLRRMMERVAQAKAEATVPSP